MIKHNYLRADETPFEDEYSALIQILAESEDGIGSSAAQDRYLLAYARRGWHPQPTPSDDFLCALYALEISLAPLYEDANKRRPTFEDLQNIHGGGKGREFSEFVDLRCQELFGLSSRHVAMLNDGDWMKEYWERWTSEDILDIEAIFCILKALKKRDGLDIVLGTVVYHPHVPQPLCPYIHDEGKPSSTDLPLIAWLLNDNAEAEDENLMNHWFGVAPKPVTGYPILSGAAEDLIGYLNQARMRDQSTQTYCESVSDESSVYGANTYSVSERHMPPGTARSTYSTPPTTDSESYGVYDEPEAEIGQDNAGQHTMDAPMEPQFQSYAQTTPVMDTESHYGMHAHYNFGSYANDADSDNTEHSPPKTPTTPFFAEFEHREDATTHNESDHNPELSPGPQPTHEQQEESNRKRTFSEAEDEEGASGGEETGRRRAKKRRLVFPISRIKRHRKRTRPAYNPEKLQAEPAYLSVPYSFPKLRTPVTPIDVAMEDYLAPEPIVPIAEAVPANTELPYAEMTDISLEELVMFFPNHVRLWPGLALLHRHWGGEDLYVKTAEYVNRVRGSHPRKERYWHANADTWIDLAEQAIQELLGPTYRIDEHEEKWARYIRRNDLNNVLWTKPKKFNESLAKVATLEEVTGYLLPRELDRN